MKRIQSAFFCALLICGISVFAPFAFAEVSNEVSDFEVVWKQTQLQKLAEHPYWLRLLHYYPPLESVGQWSFESDIRSPKFFLAANGNTDPSSELKATLKAFLVPLDPKADANTHAQCRFVARFYWIQEQLASFKNSSQILFPQVSCSAFEQWGKLQSLKSISLVFVSSYLDNPASIYGHLLLKINSNDRYFGHFLLSPTLNYGAMADPKDGMLTYAVKGLFGGYQGRFADERFYNFNHLYGESELRDMWEYPLALTPKQERRIVRHTWELLQGVQFDYYFFLDNCAYRVAELIEMAWDSRRVNPPQSLWVLPSGVLFQLAQMKQDGIPVLKSAQLIPSRQRRLRQKIQKLSSEQRQWVLKIAKNPEALKSASFLAFSEMQQAEVLDALIDYTAFLKKKWKDPESSDSKSASKLLALKKMRQQILLRRSKLPIRSSQKKQKLKKTPAILSPTEGLPYTRSRFAWIHNSVTGNALEFGLWNTYHDLLANDAGHLPDSELVTLDFKFRATPKKIWLHQVDFIRIQNLSRSTTGLPEEQAWSWRARAALLPLEQQCNTCRAFHLSGSMGKAISFSEQDLEFAFLGFFSENPQSQFSEASFGVMSVLGMTLKSTELWKLHAEIRTFQSIWGVKKERSIAEIQQRWKLPNQWDARLELSFQKAQEVRAVVQHYW